MSFLNGANRAQVAFIHTGDYTGDGAATQGITGVGFQPRRVKIWRRANRSFGVVQKTDQDGVNATLTNLAGNFQTYLPDYIISLDVDGFTVGDGTPGPGNFFNVGAEVYTYVAFR